MESDRFSLADFRKTAEIRVKKLFAQSTKTWASVGPKTKSSLIIIDCKDGFRYIVTNRLNPFIVKYKKRGNGWKWVSCEDVMGVEIIAENVNNESLRRGSLALRSLFKNLVPSNLTSISPKQSNLEQSDPEQSNSD